MREYHLMGMEWPRGLGGMREREEAPGYLMGRGDPGAHRGRGGLRVCGAQTASGWAAQVPRPL